MNKIILLIAKVMQFILSLFGRGTALPGDIALKLNKDILSYFELPKTTIFVTGTTGKTSVSGTLYEIYKSSGYKTVSNIKGSNLIGGVTSAFIKSSKLSGRTKVDVLIIECDERYIKKVFKYITPKYFIITNLSRDQLARNGHFDLVFDEINKSINSKTHLILNADDPLVTKFGINKKNEVTYYSVSKNRYSTKNCKLNTLDMCYCPNCYKKLEYDYFNYGSLGYYNCPNNDYNHPISDFEAILLDGQIKINDSIIDINNDALYNVYNILSCYSVCKIDGVKENDIVSSLNKLSLKVKRLNEFIIDDRKCTILLSKNETPISYNQSIEYVINKSGVKTVAIGFNRVSGRYDLKDLSWLYDINFELLNDDSIEKIILIGPFAYDIAARLKVANIDPKKFIYCLDYKESLDFSINKAKSDLYFIVYFDLDYYYLDELKKRGVKL